MPKTAKISAEHILPLYMNGLSGRMLRLPAPPRKKREILLIFGHHTSIERVSGMAEYLNSFGSVTSPDLPGFGGMDSFFKIGEKPTLDNYADYLASFIKFRYKNRRITILAVSFGFTVVTRMLQKNPQIAKKVDLLVSISGYVHKDDYIWKKSNIVALGGTAWFISYQIPSFIAKTLFIRGPVIRALYHAAEAKHPKLKGSNQKQKEKTIEFEIKLWKQNDFRTYCYVSSRGLWTVLPRVHIDLPVYHVAVDDDHYFDNLRVEQHMREIYSDFHLIKSHLPAHAPTILSSPKDVEPFVPPKIRELLRKNP